MSQKKKKATPDNPFTVDSEGSVVREVPTISRLLNRKKLSSATEPKSLKTKTFSRSIRLDPPTRNTDLKELTKTGADAKDQAAPQKNPPPEVPNEIREISLEASGLIELPVKTSAAIPISNTVSIKQGAPRQKPAFNKLNQWDLVTLKTSHDPMAKALYRLASNHQVHCALFLSIQPNTGQPPSEQAPQFVGSATFQPGTKEPFWIGLVWDPRVVPELWNQFIQDGMIELAPPGPNTVATSNRNVVRAGMGADVNEWMTLIRVGTTEACRGILAVYSVNSIEKEIKALLGVFAEQPKVAA